jgi:hypothetical protein
MSGKVMGHVEKRVAQESVNRRPAEESADKAGMSRSL